jgi:hypothetical protein
MSAGMRAPVEIAAARRSNPDAPRRHPLLPRTGPAAPIFPSVVSVPATGTRDATAIRSRTFEE